MQITDLFNRNLLIATKHKKEKIIAPILEKAFQMRAKTNLQFDSDQFGTFTGEIARHLSSIETVKLKAKKALEGTDYDLVVANEGSFGSHPTIYFAPANEEFMYLYDKKNEFEIVVHLLSTNTNFLIKELHSESEFSSFLEKVKFPSHAIILKDPKTNFFYKGITNKEEAFLIFNQLLAKNKVVTCETDMRAMYNPTRMQNIEELTQKLVQSINSLCPLCFTPGFQVTSIKKGLPCELCFSPTSSTLALVSNCKTCNYTHEEEYPNNKRTEDPMYCDFCNP